MVLPADIEDYIKVQNQVNALEEEAVENSHRRKPAGSESGGCHVPEPNKAGISGMGRTKRPGDAGGAV